MQTSLNSFYQNKKNRVDVRDKSKTETKKSEQQLKEAEEELRHFDLDMRYGPCKGITRSKRYENAVKFGLNPPQRAKELILKYNLEKSYYDNYI